MEKYPQIKRTSKVLQRNIYDNKLVSEEERTTLVDWFIHVWPDEIDIVSLAVCIVDRIIDTNMIVAKRANFQLIGIACLWISTKQLGTKDIPKSRELVEMCGHVFNAKSITNMEQEILNVLEFNTNIHTTVDSLVLFTGQQFKKWPTHMTRALHLTLLDIDFISFTPNEIACAIIQSKSVDVKILLQLLHEHQ